MKLSENLIARFRAICTMDFGDSFGVAPEGTVLRSANFMWSDVVFLETPIKTKYFSYSLFIDNLGSERRLLYFCIGTSVYVCKWSMINALSFVDMAILLYLIFQEHETFDLC